MTITLATTSAGQFVINRVNQLRRAAEIVLYTPHFNSRTSSAASGVDVVISGLALPIADVRHVDRGRLADPDRRRRRADRSRLRGRHGRRNVPPGERAARGAGDPDDDRHPGWESVQQAVGGREWIVRDGAVSISPHPASADEIHPRSAIGLTADGRLILATVDGRETGVSAGVRLPELAELMLERGAVSAINLDGGGSSSLVVRRAGTETPVIVNRPSDGFERPVTNSIQVISTMPTGPLST